MPCHHPAPSASATAAAAKTAVRRSSATVATISGATLNSEITTRPGHASSTLNRSSHTAAAAMATCSADGRDLAVTPAFPLTRAGFIALVPCFTGFAAQFGTCQGHVGLPRRGPDLWQVAAKASDRRQWRNGGD